MKRHSRRSSCPENYPDHILVRRDWYAYQRSVEVVDQRVGAILDQLRAEGVLDNTIVMFFADHGRPMPWGKQWLSVEGLQVPLIVRGPQHRRKSRSRNDS
jgi:N-sulfoglucosamine sulfohydrolase